MKELLIEHERQSSLDSWTEKQLTEMKVEAELARASGVVGNFLSAVVDIRLSLNIGQWGEL